MDTLLASHRISLIKTSRISFYNLCVPLRPFDFLDIWFSKYRVDTISASLHTLTRTCISYNWDWTLSRENERESQECPFYVLCLWFMDFLLKNKGEALWRIMTLIAKHKTVSTESSIERSKKKEKSKHNI